MGKWVGVGLIVLVGVSLLGGQYTAIGMLMLAGAGLTIFFSVRGSGSSRSYSMPARPGQLANARYDSRGEVAAAERGAARLVNSAREDAESEGQNALRAAMQFLSQEARWV